MVSLKELYARGLGKLADGGIEAAHFECDVLFKKHFGITGYDLIIKDGKTDFEKADSFLEDIEKRTLHEPLQYIVGEWEFMGFSFKVTKDVLIPRADTETVVSAALGKLKGIKNPVFADLCTGSGCIAVSIAMLCENSTGFAVDISPAALKIAGYNINKNRVQNRLKLLQYDVLKGSTDIFAKKSLDLVISNPPYISKADMDTLSPEVKKEPALALYGGEDGLDFYRALIPGYKLAIKEGGFICLEAGIGEADEIKKMLAESGYSNIELYRDIQGIDRAVMAQVV